MPFIPNYDSAAFPVQSEPDSVDFEILLAGIKGDGVLSGCAVSAQGTPNMTVAVASGSIKYNGSTVSVSSASPSIAAADTTNGRLDLVVVDNTGAVTSSGTNAAVKGTAASAPVMPTIPANSIVLACVYVPANDTAINSNQIIDKRMIVTAVSGGGAADGLVFTTFGIR